MGTDITIGQTSAYLSAPTSGVHPGLIVIHEVWGLSEHIKNVSDRFSAEGYVVVAPDLLSHTGITEKMSPELLSRAANPETRDEAQKELRANMAPLQSSEFAEDTITRLKQCFQWLVASKQTTGVVAVVGFCFGGTYSFSLAANEPNLACAIAFYGHAEGIMDRLDQIKAPILAFYGEKDHSLVDSLPELEEKMTEQEVEFAYKVYPNTGHAFFNDSNPTTYDAEAANDSWKQSLAFLAEYSTAN